MRALTQGIAGGLCAAFGVLVTVVFTMFASMYEPECPTYALTAANAHCRDPLFFIYGGMALAVVGVGIVGRSVWRACH